MTAAVRTPHDTITIGAYNKPAWEEALDALDESREIDWFGDKYEGKDKSGKPTGNPAVIYRRENRRGEGQPSIPVWIKQYQCNAQYDLRPFNKWEADLLERVKAAKPYVYQLIHYDQATSYLRRKNDARTVGSSSLTTSSKGASIKSWLNWPVQEGGRHYTHAFLPPGNYLRFAKAALTALNALHDCGGLVHCDLNVGNWCLRPKEAVLITGPDERIRLIIDWNHLSIIDVGYSIHPAITPRVTMPLDTSMVSPHLSQALKKVDTEGSAAYWRATNAQQTWRSFHDASLDPDFWANHAPYVLNALRKVDWREDYWKLGRLLQGLRGDHESKFSTPLRVNISTAREVNLLIGQAVETDDNGAISPAYGPIHRT